eukprot:CAMPEP_0174829538 /NCGR_PEP_ID=MMETSP1114-20130205/1981_1 /TAXON_ID=312471 /ORGANISM="Neobodo designis, Strain CCAP 1951/1" /LENGTH=519 /DNA_ID=CAMNT_0016063291 /DNA_START=49 /DNA_END=1604 /DNA_ORIENTATION=+
MSDAAGKPELSPEEVKAQREAKKAQKAARAAAAKAKKDGAPDAAAAPAAADSSVSEPASPPALAATATAPPTPATKAAELSPEEVKAQREAKKAEKQARAAAAKAKKDGDAAAAPAPAAAPAAPTAPAASSKPASAAATAPPTAAPSPSVAIDVPPNPARPLRALPVCGDVSYEFAHLGLLTRTLRLVGANARTLALLRALRDLARTDATIAATGTLNSQSASDVLKVVKRNTDFLASCRAPTSGMTWAIKTLSDRVLRTAARRDIPAKMRASDVLVRHIDDITQDIQAAVQDCATEGAQCIQPDDVVMTYGRSSSIEHAFALAAANGIDFTVIIVDNAPLFEGRGLQWRLQQRGIKTSYVLLTSVCAIMPRATRVFIGAASILQNGQVVGRAGTAIVSLVAKQFRRPLICFCETYKYTDRIWRGANANAAEGAGGTAAVTGGSLDGSVAGIGANAFGNAALGGATPPHVAPPQQPAASLARYDAGPKDAVDHVVSEIGFLHPTAIAAAIRDRDERELR